MCTGSPMVGGRGRMRMARRREDDRTSGPSLSRLYARASSSSILFADNCTGKERVTHDGRRWRWRWQWRCRRGKREREEEKDGCQLLANARAFRSPHHLTRARTNTSPRLASPPLLSSPSATPPPPPPSAIQRRLPPVPTFASSLFCSSAALLPPHVSLDPYADRPKHPPEFLFRPLSPAFFLIIVGHWSAILFCPFMDTWNWRWTSPNLGVLIYRESVRNAHRTSQGET